MSDAGRWKLGKDMIPSDTILDPVTFDDLILALKCNYAYIGETAVRTQMKEILDQRLEDVKYLTRSLRWHRMNRLKMLATMISHSKSRSKICLS